MSGITRDSQPALRAGVRLQHDRARNQWVLLAPERVVELDDIALVVAQRYDGTRSLAQIAQELAAEFDADAAQIEADVIELTDTLLQKRLLRL
ncbi:pyrroloquinoline quinone biosynthesis peptide chaperone PqqD [Xanthomonas axonopodis pv. begoniae]|uniref:pyrroloquinoline quinone biosynthesis peptide chaperone PqqD n=1 Tax=Xanthomonas phaseoli TaxID=1985254 RepID=UPI000CEDDB47|nr:pyrroloquinoline quinone biosynthesis peptide chaperone PqqD [Xanthomonas phaseoli]MBO9737940.1 pyrroloquinoline quinone biosynthesis peptide chaperone PqqD [Xanthomonas axonopodis pv. begoniae]MBO9772331.1 pyrroloquinoline quinone biosynthesis peptide chaperone PqqD [Xanthomonas axonopodis pv. begoniae]MCC8469515.1 pyrroloquinoline quinone biosynthesis peptide chaperone PqqD [Xanthomonas phaseoli]PPT41031.1 pyrroloquinoline quinone biosynthesis peptide chaperone PqqD [Xanthomonas axonopodis